MLNCSLRWTEIIWTSRNVQKICFKCMALTEDMTQYWNCFVFLYHSCFCGFSWNRCIRIDRGPLTSERWYWSVSAHNSSHQAVNHWWHCIRFLNKGQPDCVQFINWFTEWIALASFYHHMQIEVASITSQNIWPLTSESMKMLLLL